MVLMVWIVCNIIALSHSFLFDTSTKNPSTLPNNNNHDDLLHILKEQNQELQHHRRVIMELKSRVERLESNVISTSIPIQQNSCKELEQKYQSLSQQHLDLSQNYSSLYKEHHDLTQNYSSLYQEHKLLATAFLTEKNKIANQTNALEKDIAELKQGHAVGQLQTVADLQNVSSKIQNDVKMIMLNNQARAQDLVALNHAIVKNGNDIDAIKTNTANNISGLQQEIYSLNSKSQSTSQDLMSLFIQLSAVANDSKHLKETTARNISRVELQVESKTSNLNHSLNHFQQELVTLQSPVGFNAFGSSEGRLSAGTIIKFPDITSSFGLTGLSSFQSSGTFRAEKDGLYLVITSITVDSSLDTFFNIHKNNYSVHGTGMYYGGAANTGQHTIITSGTGSLFLRLSVGDTLDVRTERNMYVRQYASSLTVIKIK